MLRRAREQAGLSQRELARRAGIAYPRISEYETGRRSPTLQRLEALVEALGGTLQVVIEPPLNPADRQLLDLHLAMTPTQRLDALAALARLRGLARVP